MGTGPRTLVSTGEPPSPSWDESFDLVVVGGGAAGMTAAVVAAVEGLRTLVVEQAEQIGGTTARSGGALWLPDSPQQALCGLSGDADEAHRYLDALVGDRSDRSLRVAFIGAGPKMVAYLERHTDVRFELSAGELDYRQELPGAGDQRVLRPLPFDGRLLGAHFDRLGWPIPELMLFGGMMITRGEAARLLDIPWSWRACVLGAKLVGRYVHDRLRYQRGTRLVWGNALAGWLFRELLKRRVPIWFKTAARKLVVGDDGRVLGIVAQRDGVERRVHARRGVVLAGGGFPASAPMRDRYFPQPVAQSTPAFDGCTGETLRLAEKAGGALRSAGDNALWFPSSIAKRADGSTAVFPHIALDRAKPGLIAVNSAGRRFVDEAVSYHEFVRAMYRSHQRVPTVPATLVCDRRFLWKYGLGMIRPRALRLCRFIESGYLSTGRTLRELASAIGVDAQGLADTVTRHNTFARTGVDEEFGKGQSRYDRANGDPRHSPNPCLGPIEAPPYFAVAVFPTPLATSLGLRTNAVAQVLDAAGTPIGGLYACGNDMQSVMGGEYPGPGALIAPAMTFGYVAARHAVGDDRPLR